MMSAKEIFIHIGPDKTGTTFLQQQVFPLLNAHGIHYQFNSKITLLLLEFLCTYNPLLSDIVAYENTLNHLLAEIPATKILISSENFYGDCFNNYKNFTTNMQLLKTLFPKATIICAMRNQVSFLNSAYSQSLFEGFCIPKKDFFGLAHPKMRFKRFPHLDCYNLNWQKYITFCQKIFTKDKTKLLIYEQMRHDYPSFLRQLAAAFNLAADALKDAESKCTNTVNPSYSQLACKIAYACNRFAVHPYNTLGFLPNTPILKYIEKHQDNSRLLRLLHPLASWLSYRLRLSTLLKRGLDRLYYQKPSHLGQEKSKEIEKHYRQSNIDIAEAYGYDLEALHFFHEK